MVDIYEIVKDWEDGKITEEEANLKLIGTGVIIDSNKQKIEEGASAVYCEDTSKINGYAMLDTGTGTLDKVEIKNGELVNGDVGDTYALIVFGDGSYHKVSGKTIL